MTLKKAKKMADLAKDLRRNPTEFLLKYDKNTVINSLVQLSDQVESCEFLLVLSQCMRFYPHVWQFVREKIKSDEPPFQSIVKSENLENEPKPKRRKTDDFGEETVLKACHNFVVSDKYFHTIWSWHLLIDFLPRLKDPKAKWYAVEIVSELCSIGQIGKKDLFRNLHSEHLYEKFCLDFLHQDAVQSSQQKSEIGKLNENLCSVEGVLLPFLGRNESELEFVSLPTRSNLLKEIAQGIADRKHTFISGPLGCGKTKIIEFFVNQTGRQELVNFHRIAMNDQVDGKSLLGSYACNEVPGQFSWTNGIITKAVLSGDWLLIEDVDQAPPDVLSALEPLIQRRELHILSRGMVVRAHPGFHMFITSRLSLEDLTKLRFSKLNQQLKVTMIPKWSEEEMAGLLSSLHPKLSLATSKMITYFFSLQSPNLNDVRQRPATIRDVIKWCKRCDSREIVNEDLVLEGLDCFCSHLGKSAGNESATKLAHLFNVNSQRMFHLMEERAPELNLTKEWIKIGRVELPRIEKKKQEGERPYFLTRPAARLLEFIAMCIKMKEPALIVGETGVGKTSAIQFLAECTGHQLVAVNLNQQTESCDLIGGIKPVNVEHYLRPVYTQYLELFSNTFNVKENAKFLANLSNCWSSKKFDYLLKLMLHTAKAAGQKPNWEDIQSKINQVSKALETNSRLYFAFINGVLTKAVTEGQWILLDEINMAESDVLDCISEMLNPEIQEIRINEGSKTVQKHPDFRVFGCMNPSTDVGKKELNGIIRTRFTEYYIEEPCNDKDLLLIVSDYLKPLDLPAQILTKVVNFYKEVKKLAKIKLMDGTGHQPTFSLRTLCRALNIAAKNHCGNSLRSLTEAFILCFLTEVDRSSYELVMSLIVKKFDPKGHNLKHNLTQPQDGAHIKVEGYWLPVGKKAPKIQEEYILTPSVRRNLKDISRVVSLSNFAILLQGETSVGKTSMITYLAEATGNTCIRVNNHEHTDVQEYLGSYVVDEKGIFVFQEGVLPLAMRNGYWIILDELNLAPTDVLEALNRVLDDNRELFIPENQSLIKAHPNFRLFATQNPSGTYGGRKPLSRAFRNRFVELHFGELPHPELAEIIEKRAGIARSQSVKLVQTLHELQIIRRNSATFEGKYSFLTLRDLFRWATRCSHFKQTSRFYDWEQHFAEEGYLVLTSRSRNQDGSEEAIVRQVLQKVFKRQVNFDSIVKGNLMKHEVELITSNSSDIVWTSTAKRLALLILHSFKFKEPVLLVGETGCGKTRVCQTIAEILSRQLSIVNCHLNTESSDFLGGLRPSRESSDKPFEWVDGPLVKAMENGSVFLIDEISLAEDGVLERLNSVLESERSLFLSDLGDDGVRQISAHDSFQIVATMNPGGDFGKRELSPALRNRLVEIWCPSITERDDLISLINSHLGAEMTEKVQEVILDFISWYERQQISRKVPFTTRDLVAWMNFIKDTHEKMSIWNSLIHGICLVITDGLANVIRGESLELFLNEAKLLLESRVGSCESLQWILSQGTCQLIMDEGRFGIEPFTVMKKERQLYQGSFYFQSETVAINTLKLLRGLQIKNSSAILMEGSPGVGKSSIVSALASMTGNTLVRINLSEQTEISDLIGSDLPAEGKSSMCFEWHDGPLLAAMKSGHWILLDELNLATQSVLEGLNACLDHRAEIYIPELNKTFAVDSKSTKIFATQNPPREGGERKNLPKSFLNRFVKVHMTDYKAQDIKSICSYKFQSKMSNDFIDKVVRVAHELDRIVNKEKLFGGRGSPWQFNLRDLMRLSQGVAQDQLEMISRYLKLIFVERFRLAQDQQAANELIKTIFAQDFTPEHNSNTIELFDNSLKIGCASLPRLNLQKTVSKVDLKIEDYPILESLILCLRNNWLSILVGDGKTQDLSRYIQLLAGFAGQTCHCLTLSSATDTSELLGGFEQTSNDISISNLLNHLNDLIDKELENSNNLELIKLKLSLKNATEIQEIKAILENNSDMKHLVDKIDAFSTEVTFDWIDSILVKAIENGDWVCLTDANLCNPSVLDRLNSLMEENGSLAIGEKGCRQGQIPQVFPHPNFRMFLTMDPSEGELSPAMRNRGVEIFVKDPPRIESNAIPGEDLAKYGNVCLVSQQFSILMKNFADKMGDRALISFLTCTFGDWQTRELICQYHFQEFQHPLRSLEYQDESHLFVSCELEHLRKIANLPVKSNKADDKYLWQQLGQICHEMKNVLNNPELSLENWLDLGICNCYFERIRESFSDQRKVSVIWKNIRDILKKYHKNSFDNLEKLLVCKTNIFEELALTFTENRKIGDVQAVEKPLVQVKNIEDMFTKKLKVFPYVLEKKFKLDLHDSFKGFLTLISDLVSLDHFLDLMEISYESPTFVRDDLASLLKMFAKSQEIVAIDQSKDILEILDEMLDILDKKKNSHFDNLQKFQDKFKTFCQTQLELNTQAVDSTLPVSSTVSIISSSSPQNSALTLIKSGLLAIHVSGERSDVDISEQMEIESELKSTLKLQVQNDLLAFDSCQALFPLDQDQFSTKSVQVSRRNLTQNLTIQVQNLEEKRPQRSENEKYCDLLSELRQMKNGPLSLENVQELIKELESLKSTQKTQNWIKSLIPFIFNIPANFSSYKDIWAPFILGCAQLIWGTIQYRQNCALKLRQDSMSVFDNLRQLLTFEGQNLLEKRDVMLLQIPKLKFYQVVQSLSGNVMKEMEQKLVYEVFQDHLLTRKNHLKDKYLKNLDLIKIISSLVEFIKDKYEVEDEEDEDLEPFIKDTLESLRICLKRSVDENQELFLVPLENLCVNVSNYNKNAVNTKIIPIGKLEKLLINWRKESHSWYKMTEKIESHLEKGVEICLKSLVTFLNKPQKKIESLMIPFMLFCHNSFLADFSCRLKNLQELLKLLESDDSEVSGFLRAILKFFENFDKNCQEFVSKRKSELKMKFDVQLKANKRLYEETNLRNHFKAANSIVRENSKKLGEICLSQARSHFNFPSDFENRIFQDFQFSQDEKDEEIGHDIKITKVQFVKVLKTSVKNSEKVQNQFCEKIGFWNEDISSLCQEIQKSQKLTFHVVKTKASNMMTNLKDLGLSKSFGAKFDCQIFRILQCFKYHQKSDILQNLFASAFSLEKLSSSLLLPISAQSKAFAFCKTGQELVNHGIVLNVKIFQRLNEELQNYHGAELILKNFGQKSQKLFENVMKNGQTCIEVGEICKKMKSLPVYEEISQICSDINQENIEKSLEKLQFINIEKVHYSMRNSLAKLKNSLEYFLQFQNRQISNKKSVQDKFEIGINKETKSRFLALQTVMKKLKNLSENQSPIQLLQEILNLLEILDIESFKIGLQSLNFMGSDLPQETQLIFKSFMTYWKFLFQFGLSINGVICKMMKSASETFKKILDYKYSESKDQDEEQESQDSGEAQAGCGLGEADDLDGAQATTSDVQSEDIFDSAEKPQQNKDEQENEEEKEEKPTKEEDGFDVDNVEDDNPQEPEEQEDNKDESDDEEEQNKEDEMDTEEGKADEKIDEDAWENKDEDVNENDETQHESKEATKDDKAGHEDEKEDEKQEEKIPEDENKRQRKDEQFDNEEEEIEMNDETYGQNEPPEAEDLDMNNDDEMMGDESDDDNGNDENQPEEEVRLPDFEDEIQDEMNEEQKDENVEVSKSTGGNAGQDESKPDEENKDEIMDEDEQVDDQEQQKGDKNSAQDKKEDKNDKDEGTIVPQDDEKNIEEIGKDESKAKEDENEAMVTEDEIDETKNLPITDAPEDEQEAKVQEECQEFSHSKDKKNTLNALDAMDIDNEEKPKIKPEMEEENKTEREGKSLDMTKLKDAIKVETMTVERNTDTIFGRTEQDYSLKKDYEMKNLDEISEVNEENLHNPEDVQRWMQICHETSELTQNLTEQLRLILEATRATRFKGDYKSGKRINMRKVIPFIASNYRKDKIWLRRTKPSKRDYNVILAIDDSTSMRVNNVNHIVDKSIAIVSQTLSSLEVGKLGVVKFGKETQIVHHLQSKFNQDDGVKMLKSCQYDQEATHFVQMMQATDSMFKSAHGRSTSQLLLILSDGRGIYNEGKEKVLEHVRRLKLANVFIVFLIIENNCAESVLDMKMVEFDANQGPKVVPYLEQFPFSFYLILKDIGNLPQSLSDSIRQWFEHVSK